MTVVEKKRVVQECLAKALEEMFPEVPEVTRANVEPVLKQNVENSGLMGLYPMILDIFTNTVKTANLVSNNY